MMSDIIIKAENLGKKYIIGHKSANDSYATLRDLIMNNAKNLWHKTRDLAKGKPVIYGDTLEEVWALKDINFEILRGEAVGIIGRNGAGKSTLLKVLSRITEPSKGRVTIRGRVASLLEVGTGFHPELTGRENIYLNGTILGMTRKEIKTRFDEIVAFAEIDKFLDTPVKRYSSGMYVRLAFAVAAHLNPEILVVDEVLAVGDAAFQKKCLGKMGDVAHTGRTVLFVSHNMGAIRQLCKSGILLSDGKIVSQGSTDNVVDAYIQTIKVSRHYSEGMIACNDSFGIALLKIDLLNDEGMESHALQVGISGSIRILIETAKPLKNLLVSIAVITLNDIRVCVFHTKISDNRDIDLQPPVTQLLCKLPKVPFLPGKYRLHIKVANNNGDIIFNIPYATEIAVEGGNFFETGRLPDLTWAGVALVEHAWQVSNFDKN